MLNDINIQLIKEADKAIKSIKKEGYIAGGNNGPYNDNETPYRVCSHWIFIFSYLYNKTKEKKYYEAIQALSDYLYDEYLKNKNYVFCCRNKEGKDHVNGIIGNAWIIEGLIKSASVLKESKYYDATVNIFLSHPFNEKIALWNRHEIDGKLLGYDETFNHQLWFAAAGCEIINYKDNEIIRKQINKFLEKCIGNNYNIHSNGLIRHFLCVNDNIKHIVKYYKGLLQDDMHNILRMPSMKYKEEGYHYFAMYGFAIIYSIIPNHIFFKSRKFKKSLKYTFIDNNYQKLTKSDNTMDGTKLAKEYKNSVNIYSYPYNSPAFELPYITQIFMPEDLNSIFVENLWNIQKQITITNSEFIKNTNDPVTLVSRMYELTRALEAIKK